MLPGSPDVPASSLPWQKRSLREGFLNADWFGSSFAIHGRLVRLYLCNFPLLARLLGCFIYLFLLIGLQQALH